MNSATPSWSSLWVWFAKSSTNLAPRIAYSWEVIIRENSTCIPMPVCSRHLVSFKLVSLLTAVVSTIASLMYFCCRYQEELSSNPRAVLYIQNFRGLGYIVNVEWRGWGFLVALRNQEIFESAASVGMSIGSNGVRRAIISRYDSIGRMGGNSGYNISKYTSIVLITDVRWATLMLSQLQTLFIFASLLAILLVLIGVIVKPCNSYSCSLQGRDASRRKLLAEVLLTAKDLLWKIIVEHPTPTTAYVRLAYFQNKMLYFGHSHLGSRVQV